MGPLEHRHAAPEAGHDRSDSTFGTPFDLNLIGLWTLYLREVRRFLKVPGQTLLAPVVTTLMFLLIFSLALGRNGRVIEGLSFLEFLAPGLIMMAVIQNAFANTSASILIGKIQGNIVDVLMPPLRPSELMFGIVAGGVTRGVLVAVIVPLAMLPAVSLEIADPLLALYYVIHGSLMLALLGLLGGLWAEKFDQMAAVTNFVITPLSFLSGTFYSIAQLPGPVFVAAHLNPFFYLIDGLRFGFTGHADGSIVIGAIAVAAVNVAFMGARPRPDRPWLPPQGVSRGVVDTTGRSNDCAFLTPSATQSPCPTPRCRRCCQSISGPISASSAVRVPT